MIGNLLITRINYSSLFQIYNSFIQKIHFLESSLPSSLIYWALDEGFLMLVHLFYAIKDPYIKILLNWADKDYGLLQIHFQMDQYSRDQENLGITNKPQMNKKIMIN